jgi:hypothetical protein
VVSPEVSALFAGPHWPRFDNILMLPIFLLFVPRLELFNAYKPFHFWFFLIKVPTCRYIESEKVWSVGQ